MNMNYLKTISYLPLPFALAFVEVETPGNQSGESGQTPGRGGLYINDRGKGPGEHL